MFNASFRRALLDISGENANYTAGCHELSHSNTARFYAGSTPETLRSE